MLTFLKIEAAKFFKGPERGLLGRIGSSQWAALRIATIGTTSAFFGALLVVLGAQVAGKIIVILGIAAGVIGIVWNFLILLDRIVRHKNPSDPKH